MDIKKLMLKILNIKEKVPNYPNDFGVIDWTPIARQNGIKDEQNKIIIRFFFDSLGNRKIKQYRYSESRVRSLQEVYKIPIYDKTKHKETIPIFARILPSEVSYKR